MRIVVVGAGSIGANIGYSLANAGATVTVVDGSGPASGTSGASLSWLASFPQLAWREHPGRAALRHRVYDSFTELQDEIGGDWLHWAGTLTWGTPSERESLRIAAEKVSHAGVDVEVLNAAEVSRRYPGLASAVDDEFIWEPGSGWVDAPHMVRRLVAAIEQRGGTVETGRAVVAFIWDGDRIQGARLSDGTEILADRIVIATGAWGTHLAAMAGLSIPMSLAPGLVVKTEPLPAGVELPVLNSPSFSSRPDPSGGMAVHWRGRPMLPEGGASPQQTGNGHSPQATINDVAKSVPSLAGTAPASARVGIRALPDGGPIIGSLPGRDEIYFALSHGGIGWGPTWGWAARRELLEQDTVAELSGMRPDRYFRADASVGRFADDAEQTLSIAPSG